MANIADVSISMSLDANGVIQGAASVTKAVDDVAKSANDVAKMFDFAGEAMQQFAEWEKQAAATTQALVAPLDDTRVAMQQVVQMQQELGRLFEKTRTPVERLEAQLKHLDELRPFANTPDQMQAVQRATDDVVEKLRKLEDAELDAAEAAKKLAAESDLPVVVGKIAPAVDTATNKLDTMANVQGRATLAAMNFSRVIQDAPFGILGVANNIEPLLQSLQALRKDADAAGVKTSTLGLIFKELSGATGILVGAGALGALLTVMPQIIEGFKAGAVKIREYLSNIDVVARGYANTMKSLTQVTIDANLKIEQSLSESLAEAKFRLDMMKQGIFDLAEQTVRYQRFQAQLNIELARMEGIDVANKIKALKDEAESLQRVYDAVRASPKMYEGKTGEMISASDVQKMNYLEKQLKDVNDQLKFQESLQQRANNQLDEAARHYTEIDKMGRESLSVMQESSKLQAMHERSTAAANKAQDDSVALSRAWQEEFDGVLQYLDDGTDKLRDQSDEYRRQLKLVRDIAEAGSPDQQLAALTRARSLGLDESGTAAATIKPLIAELDQLSEFVALEVQLRDALNESLKESVKEARSFTSNVMNRIVSVGQGALFSSGLGASAGGALGGAIGTMFGSPQVGAAVGEEIGRALSPALDELANKLGVIEPIVATFDAVIGVLTPAFQALLPFVEGLRAGIEPLIKPLQDVLAFFAVPLLLIGRAFQFIALIAGVVGKALEFITQPLYDAAKAIDDFFVFLINGFIDTMNGIFHIINGILSATGLGDFRIALFDRVQNAFLDRNTEAVEKNTEAVQSFAEALTNVPSGFKINAARFRSTMPVFTGGGGITVQSMTVVANNPDQLHKQLQKMNANRNNLRFANVGAPRQ